MVLDDYPFLRHEFLLGLERSGCVGAGPGWQPQYLLAYDSPDCTEILAAVPLYIKHHSYGEYVFDWAWANAYHHAGIEYYPKLVAAIPFTPANGPRVLIKEGLEKSTILPKLNQSILDYANKNGCSSAHWLFCTKEESNALCKSDFMLRTGFQFHWNNQNYKTFDDYVKTFSSKKRKNVRHERRDVTRSGVRMKALSGNDITRELWQTFYEFYHRTIRNHGAIPYLNLEFFLTIGNSMAENILMVVAERSDRIVATGLFFKSNDTLFGRYWGCNERFDKLHFETCYYQGIEYCIQHGLKTFEAGAQGQHKLSRGFIPTTTYSAHWLRHPQFYQAVEHFLQQEKASVAYNMDIQMEHSPFKKSESSTT